MGGEKLSISHYTKFCEGSPPHGRGKAAGASVGRLVVGITPAWAGKRLGLVLAPAPTWDHPRMGGEKAYDVHGQTSHIGSPPHGRGKVGAGYADKGRPGITPAWAGKSFCLLLHYTTFRDHPRMGGEKGLMLSNVPVSSGSPPHGRGKAHELRTLPRAVRITPAWAGKSRAKYRAESNQRDHPRMGGEKLSSVEAATINQGSPPHGRGKARHLSHGLLPCG